MPTARGEAGSAAPGMACALIPPMPSDRMYRVIVLSGIGLVGCGGTIVGETDGGNPDSFPVEGPAMVDSGPPEDANPYPDGFPSELAQRIDSGPEPDGFPSETAMAVDSGPPDGFAMEGPILLDGGKAPDAGSH
jgi:hypothetical protein